MDSNEESDTKVLIGARSGKYSEIVAYDPEEINGISDKKLSKWLRSAISIQVKDVEYAREHGDKYANA